MYVNMRQSKEKLYTYKRAETVRYKEIFILQNVVVILLDCMSFNFADVLVHTNTHSHTHTHTSVTYVCFVIF